MKTYTLDQQKQCYDMLFPNVHPRTLKRIDEEGAEKALISLRKDVEYTGNGKTFTEEHWEQIYNAMLYYENVIKS